jgi:alpha-glucosidase (family GH31 glycosyl hydrolase)
MSQVGSIRHHPCGLHPFVQSGYERRPYFPVAGEKLTLGCCVSKPSAGATLGYTCGGVKQPDVAGVYAWDNEHWVYYSFTIILPDEPCLLEYSFTDGDKSSAVFSAETVTIRENAPVELCLSDNGRGVSFFATFNDKVILKQEPELSVFKDEALAWVNQTVRLWTDRTGRAYQTEFNVTLKGKALYGFGEKFDRVNQAGLAPLSYVVEKFTEQCEKTYLPIPFFYTEKGAGFFLHGTWRTQFTTETGDGVINVRMLTECPQRGNMLKRGDLARAEFLRGTPAELIKSYTELSGKPALPPKWAFGPWMSSNGWNTQQETEENIRRTAELDIPATVLVLEAWSDEETFYIWNDAQYEAITDGSAPRYADFTFPADGKWPDPKRLAALLDEQGIKLVLWQIPVVKDNPTTPQHIADTEHALANGYCVTLPDGSPYVITDMWFGNSMLPDFTNPDACHWWFEKRRYLIDELGVAGFKTDGGEFLFDREAVLHDGRTAAEAHNEFPNIYIGAYHSFMTRTLGEGNGVTFSRAGYTGAQRFPMHWAGDQLSTFAELRGQITAGLSLGLSGVPFWGFDIGGFAGDFPTAELYLRSVAFAAFAPVMQYHSEPRNGQFFMTDRSRFINDRTPWNIAEAAGDERIVPIYRKFAKLRMKLLPYLWEEAKHCVKTSRPLMAHLIYDFHDDPNVTDIEDEYMLGRGLLVAPVISEGAAGRTVYLPAGDWYDFWTGVPVSGGSGFYCECGLDSIPVFKNIYFKEEHEC